MKNYLIHIEIVRLLLSVAIFTIAIMKKFGFNRQNDFKTIYVRIVVGRIVGKIQIIQKTYEKEQLKQRIYICNHQRSTKELIK